MNGAEALIQTLADSGVDVCFANPGTSEMQLVAAIDGQPKMRAVLGLFEGVVTGAADGYGRMAGKPAATLLHLGPGLANGGANLHNAKRALTPIVNIVGDHAVDHLDFDAPLTSDIAGAARAFSNWVETSLSPDDLAQKGARAVEASLSWPGAIATLIAPANHAWEDAEKAPVDATAPEPPQISDAAITKAATALEQQTAPKRFFLAAWPCAAKRLTQPVALPKQPARGSYVKPFRRGFSAAKDALPLSAFPILAKWPRII